MEKKIFCKKIVACCWIVTLLFSTINIFASPRIQKNLATDELQIPEDALYYNGHYYYIYDINAGWDEAQKYCESVGGYLATITSEEENEAVYQYLRNQGYESAYFGYTDKEEEDVWKWITGERNSYTNWHENEPNDEFDNEDYGMFYYKYPDGTWNDGSFEDLTTFICEWGDYEEYVPSFDYINDTWNFENPTSRIPVSAYQMFFDKAIAKRLQKEINGENGHCAGMVLSTMASFLGFPKANSYGDYDYLNEIGKNMRSDVTLCKAIDYVNYAFAYQFTPKFSMMKNSTGECYEGLYEAVKEFEDNDGEPVYIGIGTEEAGHALMGLSIAGETLDKTKILVYDCNHPNTKCYLTLKGKPGEFYGWSYDIDDESTWGDSDKGSRIGYVTMASEFISDYKVGYAKKNEPLLMKIRNGVSGIFNYCGNKIYLNKLDQSDLDSVIPISSDSGENNSDNNMYWVDDSKEKLQFNDLEKNSMISLAKDDLEISAKNNKTSNISIDINQKSIEVGGQKDSEFYISYDTSKDYENSDVSIINGDTNKTAIIKQTQENEFIITGIKKINVTCISKKDYNDGTSNSKEEQKISIKKANENIEYKINNNGSANNKEITVSEDKDKDGIFETVVASTKKKKIKKLSIKAISNKIAAGKKVKLTAMITPVNATNKTIKWTTSNKKFATVNKNGVVSTNKKAGGKKVKISAQSMDGSKKKISYTIKIMKGAVKKIKIYGSKTIKSGKSIKLKAKITASKGANKKLQWTSSNTKYATVSSTGTVKALKNRKGKSVKITAKATDGSGKNSVFVIKIK